MNPLSQLSSEALLEQGTSLVKKTAQAVGQQTQATAQTTMSQLTGMPLTQADGSMPPIQRDKATTDFIKDLYGSSTEEHHPILPSLSEPSTEVKEKQEKAATDQKLADTRQKLSQLLQSQHTASYYNPTFNRPKPPEEKPVEKLEMIE